MELLAFGIGLFFAFFIGTYFEKKHYKSIRLRERKFRRLPAVTIKSAIPADDQIDHVRIVMGSVVVSLDHFKRFIASLSLIFGGRIASYETLLDRARREAILRMKAVYPNADLIANVRIETSAIGSNANQKKQIGSVEAIAYGTAIFTKK
jgi:uncharacterized protein YbjQ (UPF0145 family)